MTIKLIAGIVMTLIITMIIIAGTVLMYVGADVLYTEAKGHRAEYPSIVLGIIIILAGVGVEVAAAVLFIMAVSP